jgi:hypothetical protein
VLKSLRRANRGVAWARRKKMSVKGPTDFEKSLVPSEIDTMSRKFRTILAPLCFYVLIRQRSSTSNKSRKTFYSYPIEFMI